MIEFIIGLIIGLLAGVFIGFAIVALLAANEPDRYEETHHYE